MTSTGLGSERRPAGTVRDETERAGQLKWYASPRTLLRTLLMLDDTPQAIALGTAVGMFIGLTPTVGIQMVLVVALAFCTRRLIRFNRVAALITVYISNPVTVVPIYWFDYQVGTLLAGGRLTRDDLAAMLHYGSPAEWWQTLVQLFAEVGAPLILGALIVASVGAAVTYPAMYRLLIYLRRGRGV